mgnify:FL=1
MTDNTYKPFERKPLEETADYKARKAKWDKEQSEVDVKDLSHRRFNVTLQPKAIVESFKKCVRKGELSQDTLATCYRVVLQRLLADPDFTDEQFIELYSTIQGRASDVFARRAAKLRNGIK